MELQREELKFCTFALRLKTFKNWPHKKNAKCNPEEMSRAGFYCPDKRYPDAKCFVCDKELDGWDAEDDPMSEHKDHSPDCPFVLLNKTEKEIIVEDFLQLVCDRAIFRIKREGEVQKAALRKHAGEVRKQIEKLL